MTAGKEYSPSKLWSIKELAVHMAVSDDTVRRLIKANRLKASWVRGCYRIPHESYIAYLQSLQRAG